MSLVISNLNKSYQSGESRINVLTGLNLNVDTGEVVAILGQSGSGKSTLLSLMGGLDKFDQGEIQIFDQKYSDLSLEQLTHFRGKNIGIVFQRFHLVPHLTALENVQLSLEILGLEGQMSDAIDLLQQVGLKDRLHHFPHQLSGGECQRVAIARSLVVKPKLMLADEPSGSLDVDTGTHVMDLFFELVKKHNTTTLLVTHNPELAKKCRRTFVLEKGQLRQQV